MTLYEECFCARTYDFSNGERQKGTMWTYHRICRCSGWFATN